MNGGKARGLIPSHSSREFSFFLFSKLKRPLGKRESPVSKEVRTIQASTHHCSQTPWGLGLLLSLGYPVGLVPLYGAGAWNEVRRLLRWNLITTKCRRDCENIFNVTGIGYVVVLFHAFYLYSCTGKANKTTLEVLFSRCYFQSGIYGPLKTRREKARGNAARARCQDTRDKEALILTRVALLSFRVLRRLNFNTESLFIYKLWQLTNCFIRKSFMCLLW